MSADFIYEPTTYIQSTLSDTWTIEHNLSRVVSYKCYDDLGNEIIPSVLIIDNNSFSLKFYENGVLKAYKGKVVIL